MRNDSFKGSKPCDIRGCINFGGEPTEVQRQQMISLAFREGTADEQPTLSAMLSMMEEAGSASSVRDPQFANSIGWEVLLGFYHLEFDTCQCTRIWWGEA